MQAKRAPGFRTDLAVAHPVNCDPDRIGQLLSNLLGNALSHGDPVGEIEVRARSDERASPDPSSWRTTSSEDEERAMGELDGKVAELHVLGDAWAPRRITFATQQGHELGKVL